MNILKFRKDANECAWVAADQAEFMNVTDANTVIVNFLGTGDDLAYDEMQVGATGKSSEVAEVLAGHIHQSAIQKGGIVNVAAIPGVTAIGRITAD